MKIVEIIRQTSDVSKDILKKTVIDHIDRTLKDVESMLRVAETGVTLEFDLFGMEVCLIPYIPYFSNQVCQLLSFIFEVFQLPFRADDDAE